MSAETVICRFAVALFPARTCAVFDRYNVVDESDLRIAARTLENHGRVLDTVTVSEAKNTKPRSLSSCGASGFRSCGGALGTGKRTGLAFVADIDRGPGKSLPDALVRVRRPRVAG